MKKFNGVSIEEIVEVGDSDRALGSETSLRRLMQEGDAYFWGNRKVRDLKYSMRDMQRISIAESQSNKKGNK